jgi:putative hemolysin
VPSAPSIARLAAAYPPAPEGLPPPARQGRYDVRFATTPAELDAVTKLRYEVFNLELGEGFSSSHETGRDVDVFDAQCHHMMVLVPGSGRVVGTYRLQTRAMAESALGFYCAGEFDLSGLPAEVLEGSVELGRACAAKDHRDGQVLYSLWRGLTSYLVHNGKRWYFGCSSLTSQDPVEGLRMHRRLLEEGHVHPMLRVEPLPALDCRREATDDGGPPPRIPRLFDTYLRYGAKVLGPPAIDREFKTVDFLVLLDTHAFLPRLKRLLYGALLR